MSLRMEQNGNGQQPETIAVDTQSMMDALTMRVQQLTMENVMLQALLNQKERDGRDTVPESAELHERES